MEDFASDAVRLRLESASTTRKLIFMDYADSGNKSVTVVSLVFIIVRSFEINSRTADWQETEIYSFS